MSTGTTKAPPAASSRTTTITCAALCALMAAVAALLFAGAASATTYPVSGTQITVNEDAGKYRMQGGLVGRWQMTSFKEVAKSPIYRGKGTERFTGCLDVRRDHSCAGDPSGTISFRFLYWGRFGSDGSLVWGSCWHPITGGTGDFAGAQGVLVMVDTPTGHGVRTAYTGNVTIGAGAGARSSAAISARCG